MKTDARNRMVGWAKGLRHRSAARMSGSVTGLCVRPVLSPKGKGMESPIRFMWPSGVVSSVLCKGRMIDIDDLPPQIRETGGGSTVTFTLPVTMEDAEMRLILETISYAKGNKTKAADLLGIGRKTLHRKLAERNAEEQ